MGLDRQFALGIDVGASPLAELGNIVTATWEYRDAQGRVGLLLVLDNAISYVEGSGLAASLTDIRRQILVLLDQPGFVQQPPMPATNDQFVVGTCRVELPPPPASATPSQRDWAYVNDVQRCYRVYQPPDQYTGVDLIAPADFIAGDIIHQQTRGEGPTLQYWTLCRTHQKLIDCRRLLVLGPPGIGKTSLMQFFTWQYVNLTGMIFRNGTAPPPATLLPVMVSLAGWQAASDQQPSLLDYIKNFLQNPPGKIYPPGKNLITQLDQYLDPDHLYEQSRLIFFFDDYSRMIYRDRASYQRHWEELCSFAQAYDQAAIVIICREVDYDGGWISATPNLRWSSSDPGGKSRLPPISGATRRS